MDETEISVSSSLRFSVSAFYCGWYWYSSW